MTERKNPPRSAAGGFRAKQISLVKTPFLCGPVNGFSSELSTAGIDQPRGDDGRFRHPTKNPAEATAGF
jgi:hypothetical protein